MMGDHLIATLKTEILEDYLKQTPLRIENYKLQIKQSEVEIEMSQNAIAQAELEREIILGILEKRKDSQP